MTAIIIEAIILLKSSQDMLLNIYRFFSIMNTIQICLINFFLHKCRIK